MRSVLILILMVVGVMADFRFTDNSDYFYSWDGPRYCHISNYTLIGNYRCSTHVPGQVLFQVPFTGTLRFHGSSNFFPNSSTLEGLKNHFAM